MAALAGAPTVQPVLHYDWTRKFFRHAPGSEAVAASLDASYCYPGTVLEAALADPDGLDDALLVSYYDEAAPPRRKVLLWHGDKRLVTESLNGFFDGRYTRLRPHVVEEVAPRLGSFLVLHPDTQPLYVIGVDDFVAAGISHETLERLFDAPVSVASQAHYTRAAYVPSLRVYVPYDGARYGDSSKKVFYDRHGHGVAVELVAREILQRLAYQVIPPSVFTRLFFALTGRPPSHFRPDEWTWVDPRRSPLRRAAAARDRIQRITGDPVGGTIDALEELARRRPYADFQRPEDALPLITRFATRTRLQDLLETLGRDRYLAMLTGMLAGHRVVAADWYAWQPGTRRAFPVEVKSRGDTLRPYQKESILFAQASGLLEYRLLELLHEKDP
jgi:hypothetical protein